MSSLLGFALQIMTIKAQQSLPPSEILFKPFHTMENFFHLHFLSLQVDYNLFATEDHICFSYSVISTVEAQ